MLYKNSSFCSIYKSCVSTDLAKQIMPILCILCYLTTSESESELLYDWRFTASQFVLATCPLRLRTSNFIFQLNTCGYSPYVISSLTRGCVCRLQLLLVLASAVILRSESRGTHDHILLSPIRDSPNLEGQVPVFLSPRNRVARLYLQSLRSLFVASHVKVKVMSRPTAQSASLPWNKALIWGLRPDLYYRQTVAGLLIRGALSDENGSVVCQSHSQQ
jgi:hypothetical protein